MCAIENLLASEREVVSSIKVFPDHDRENNKVAQLKTLDIKCLTQSMDLPTPVTQGQLRYNMSIPGRPVTYISTHMCNKSSRD